MKKEFATCLIKDTIKDDSDKTACNLHLKMSCNIFFSTWIRSIWY